VVASSQVGALVASMARSWILRWDVELVPQRIWWSIFFVTLCQVAVAQTSTTQFWPELDAYHALNQTFRLKFVASRSVDGNSYHSLEIGPTLNIFAKRLVRPRRSTLKEENDHLLSFGVGYRYLAGINQETENRVELDVTPHFPLPWKLQAASRNRVDLRFIQGSEFSWRYRNQLTLQRSMRINRFSFSPYAQGEFFYSSASTSWNKITLQAGADIPVGKHLEFEPYFERDHNIGSTPEHVNAVGLTTSIYF
jgi:hypothetical protein